MTGYAASLEKCRQNVASAERSVAEAKAALAVVERQARELVTAAQNAQAKAFDEGRRRVVASLTAATAFLAKEHSPFAIDLQDNAQQIEAALDALDPPVFAEWNSGIWQDWVPSGDVGLASEFRVGSALIPISSGLATPLRRPVMLPLIGSGHSFLLRYDPIDDDKAKTIVQSLLLRLALHLPRASVFTLLDPLAHGLTFPIQKYLPKVRDTQDMARAVLDVEGDIRRINRDIVGATGKAFHEQPVEVLERERFEFVFAADFCKSRDYDRRVIDTLLKVANSGPKAGRYVFILMPKDGEIPRDSLSPEWSKLESIDLDHPPKFFDVVAEWDRAPEVALQSRLLQASMRGVRENRVTADVFRPSPSEWWQENAETRLAAPIGSPAELRVVFGLDVDGGQCVHGALAATTGAGKSNFLHVMLMALAYRYAPAELRLFLVDGKSGVEFKPYEKLPHAEVVSLNTHPVTARSILSALVKEMRERYALFKHPDVGVQDFGAYRAAGQPRGKLPRILLVVDEYQILFREDDEGQASKDMREIAEKGRAAGVHMMLGSQRFQAPGMLDGKSIFGNIHMLVGMMMAPQDVQSLVEVQAEGRKLIRQCDKPGRVVVNTKRGEDGGNVFGNVALQAAKDRQDDILQMAEMAAKVEFAADVPETTILDGTNRPKILELRALRALFEAAKSGNSTAFQEVVQRPSADGGLGADSWKTREAPMPIIFGKQLTVFDPAFLVLRLADQENVAVVGGDAEARGGLMSGFLASIAVRSAGPVSIDVFDPDDGEFADLVASANDVLGVSGRIVRQADDFGTALRVVLDDIAARRAKPGAEMERRIVFLYQLDRLPSSAGESRAAADLLRRALAEGPRVGVHFVVTATGMRQLGEVVDRRAVELFGHRIAMPMSEKDSHDFINRRTAHTMRPTPSDPPVELYAAPNVSRPMFFQAFQVSSPADFAKLTQR